ncbi:hypothetical protein EJB05_57807 [Eragrostis curvula]|uniref:F-box domain-containing protein n=1 Tax=Eragrostis curvula TaxID=38414 RepID=A0A5J9SDS0_9POAL|nr:hypothetical protein EJB05_57807 [Eragrostis curvula]
MVKTNEGLKEGSRKTIKSNNGIGCVEGQNFKRTAESISSQLHHLPPDVLRSILLRLPFRDSCRMGALSHKWQGLWRQCCSKVIFTKATMFHSANTNLRRTRANFARRVNNILKQLCSTATLNKFVVKFGMRRKHSCLVDRWIQFCAAAKARHITLDFTPGMAGLAKGSPDDKYIFPMHVFSGADRSSAHLKSLYLGYVCLHTASAGFTGFANLKKLTLHNVSVTGDLQCLMLPECAVLEWLSITCCTLPVLTVCQPLNRLRYLRCNRCSLEKIELQAPNLATFDLTNRPISFALGGSPRMVEATIYLLYNGMPNGDNLDYIYTKLPAALPHVQKLSITSRLSIYDEVLDVPESTSLQSFAKTSARFINLRHLNLYLPLYGDKSSIGGVLRLSYFLELAPVLEELELHVDCCDASIQWALRGDMPPHQHDNLKRVLMSGACCWEGTIELAYYILRSASKLQCMIMDPMIRIEPCAVDEWILADINKGRKMAKKLLEREEFKDILTIL